MQNTMNREKNIIKVIIRMYKGTEVLASSEK